jgi:hypothetical protein
LPIVIPASVTGTFGHPAFAPNVQKIAQMKLKGLMPSDPLGGASGILGNLLGQKNTNPNQGQQPNTQQQPNPVDQILDIFGAYDATDTPAQPGIQADPRLS